MNTFLNHPLMETAPEEGGGGAPPAAPEDPPADATPPETAPGETKEPSRTTKFQLRLQTVISEAVGKKVSRQAAWDLFKQIVSATVQDVVEHGRLPLQGVGTFEIIQAGARKSKLITHHFVPKFRFRPGSKISQYLEKAVAGVHKTAEEQAQTLKDNPELQEYMKPKDGEGSGKSEGEVEGGD